VSEWTIIFLLVATMAAIRGRSKDQSLIAMISKRIYHIKLESQNKYYYINSELYRSKLFGAQTSGARLHHHLRRPEIPRSAKSRQ